MKLVLSELDIRVAIVFWLSTIHNVDTEVSEVKLFDGDSGYEAEVDLEEK